VQAKVAERLLFKHWNEWRNRKRAHVFVIPSNGGVASDLTPGDFDAPPYGASTGVDYAFSPDSREVAFLKNPDKIEAIFNEQRHRSRFTRQTRPEEHHGFESRLRCRTSLHT
jgi:hypothetical protein